ncbi:MAG TPA: helix-turn-helix domain-containing protein [Dehalococcoidia bacterium]|nr:helix-turn-helix domain-containing protein [Dehalococcoidia bacterium]
MSIHERAAEILREVAQERHLTIEQITGRGRYEELTEARREAVKRLDRELGLTLTDIGRLLGGRDHSTISLLRQPKARKIIQQAGQR